MPVDIFQKIVQYIIELNSVQFLNIVKGSFEMGRERQIQKNEETRKAIIDAAVSIGLEEGFEPVFAFTVGKLKVEGDLGKALEIQKLIKK